MKSSIGTEFRRWASQFILITQSMIEDFDTEGLTLDETKMQFSHKHQDLFEDSWAIRRISLFPLCPLEEAKEYPHNESGDGIG